MGHVCPGVPTAEAMMLSVMGMSRGRFRANRSSGPFRPYKELGPDIIGHVYMREIAQIGARVRVASQGLQEALVGVLPALVDMMRMSETLAGTLREAVYMAEAIATWAEQEALQLERSAAEYPPKVAREVRQTGISGFAARNDP
jgi:hypothetical protein